MKFKIGQTITIKNAHPEKQTCEQCRNASMTEEMKSLEGDRRMITDTCCGGDHFTLENSEKHWSACMMKDFGAQKPKHQFAPGQDVMIRSDHGITQCNDACASLVSWMEQYQGTTQRIRATATKPDRYFLEGVKGWEFSPCMFEPIQKPKPQFEVGDKVKVVRYVSGDNYRTGYEATVTRVLPGKCGFNPAKADYCYHITEDGTRGMVCALPEELELAPERTWKVEGYGWIQVSGIATTQTKPLQDKEVSTKMAKFKEGDWVEVVEDCYPMKVGECARVCACKGQDKHLHGILAHHQVLACFHEEYWKISSPKPKQTMLKKLSILAKKSLDKDTQNYVRLEWLDNNLEVTEAGVKAHAAAGFNSMTIADYASACVKESEKDEAKK